MRKDSKLRNERHMPNESAKAGPTEQAELPSLGTFLQKATPGQEQEVSVVLNWEATLSRWELVLPFLALYCEFHTCEDFCFFDPDTSHIPMGHDDATGQIYKLAFASYTCRHCMCTSKVFALRVQSAGGSARTAKIMKFGEDPPAVGPTPRSLRLLLGDQWNLFLQGRRSELAGLGIGAFVYYRRVIENVWQNVLGRLIDVARLDGTTERLDVLTKAQQEKKFTRSMDAAKGAVPSSLYVDNNNPFQALYDACGDGLHEYSDEECVARACVIRLVLARFADRAKAVLSEDKEFRQALGGLAAKTSV
jgi:hypothetical protein